MHVLFLTDNFPPEVNAPASRTFEHCKEWVKSGNTVSIITCVPNFPKGRVYKGYTNRLWQSEYMNGIRVIRVWSYISPNEGFLKRTLDYISFMFSAIIASCFILKVDVVIGTSPQFFTACGAFCVASLKRIPWIFELRDIWPATISTVGAIKQSKVLNLIEKVELFLYRKSTGVISVTHSFRENLISRGIDEKKIYVVTNGVDLSRFKPQEKNKDLLDRYGLKNKIVIGYIGTHGLCHGLETIVFCAEKLRTASTDFCFLMLGDGACKPDLVKQAKSRNIGNIVFLDSVPKFQVSEYWSLLDISVIHLKKAELFQTVIPSKLFECMGMAIPIAHGVEGESAEIVNEEEVGLCFEPENVDSLCSVIERLASDEKLYLKFKENGPKAASNYDRTVLAQQMLAVIEKVVHTKPS
tara:strand:- start:690 stop:1922 length:1233 start_codon:yes stop_codon:yes gene_type:complete